MEPIYKPLSNGEIVKGVGLPIFIRNGGIYFLDTLKVYEDGTIWCWELVDFDGFVKKVESGWVVTQVPQGAEIARHHSFYGKADGLTTYVKEGEFVKEVRDVLDGFQKKPTSSQRCREAFINYLRSPGDATGSLLKDAYFEVPQHLRKYTLGSMDYRDGPIKFVLEGKVPSSEQLRSWREEFDENR